MNMHELTSIAAAIVAVAMVTTIVSHPGTAGVIRASGDAFSGSIRAALGK